MISKTNLRSFIIIFILILTLIFALKLFLGIYMSKKSKYIMVFDLDETLGHFSELGAFCEVIQDYNKRKITFNEFYKLMDLFPEFLRPDILKILSFLKNKKKKKRML